MMMFFSVTLICLKLYKGEKNKRLKIGKKIFLGAAPSATLMKQNNFRVDK